jgi:hypothetical protein
VALRQKIVAVARWGIAHEEQIHYCVPADHRILTRAGLRSHAEVNVGDEVAVFDAQTHEVRYEPLLSVHVFPYSGEMLELSNYGATILCTPDHRWPTERLTEWSGWRGYERLYGGERSMKTAKAMTKRDLIPLSGTYTALKSVLTPRHAAILGCIVTDGTATIRTRKGGRELLYARIAQGEHKYLAAIVALTGRPATAMRTDGVAVVTPAREDMEVIETVYRAKDQLPEIVGRLSLAAAEAMWDAMMKAEGTNGFCFRQRPGPVMEAFRILSFLTGRSGVMRSSNGMNDFYVRARRAISWRNVRTTRWTGSIWCPSTPSGTWVVEHEGMLLPTGNSQTRPMPLRRTLPLATDCSGFATLCYYLAGAPDPNGLGYIGQGYTGNLLRHLPQVEKEHVRPGDIVVWGQYPGRHCAVALEAGEDPLLASHGQERGPVEIRFSEEQRSQAGRPATWLDGLP